MKFHSNLIWDGHLLKVKRVHAVNTVNFRVNKIKYIRELIETMIREFTMRTKKL
jgi:hypothetical protein